MTNTPSDMPSQQDPWAGVSAEDRALIERMQRLDPGPSPELAALMDKKARNYQQWKNRLKEPTEETVEYLARALETADRLLFWEVLHSDADVSEAQAKIVQARLSDLLDWLMPLRHSDNLTWAEEARYTELMSEHAHHLAELTQADEQREHQA